MNNPKPKSQKGEKSSNDDVNIGGKISKSVFIDGNNNTVNIRENEKTKNPENNKLKKSNPIITVAWIGFAATILAALITVIGNNPNLDFLSGTASFVTDTAASTLLPSPVPTDTVPPGAPTSTQITPTNTPTLTPSPIPPVPLGEDWIKGCISTIWSAYPASIQPEEKGDGCWKEPIHAFSAENGDLDFFFERQSGGEEIYGLFTPFPTENGKVTLTIRLKDLSNADLMIGVFSQADVYSQGLLMIMLRGGVEKNVFIQKDPFNYETLQGTQQIKQGNGYSITFEFDNLSARSIINPAVFFTDSVSIPSSQKYLFLGYKGLSGYYRIEGTFLNFKLEL